MEYDFRDDLLNAASWLEEWENTPRSLDNPYHDMSAAEILKLLNYQQEERTRLLAMIDSLRENIASMAQEMAKSGDKQEQLLKIVEDLQTRLKETNLALVEANKEKAAMARTIQSLEQRLAQGNGDRFGSKSQKANKPKDTAKRRDQDKDDFDGTPQSVSPESTIDTAVDDNADKPKERTTAQKAADLLRTGSEYRRTNADETISHSSDISRLPEGALIVKKTTRYAYEEVTRIIEHEYEIIVYKLGGRLYNAYLPAQGEPEYIDKVPGTKASAGFLAHLSFNRFMLDTPLYREIRRLTDLGMTISRKTLTNWLYKGSLILKPIVEQLKRTALEKDSIINCDETWCRVKTFDRYRKRYIWCLVNREAKIVIYCYENNGARSREALKKIIGDTQIKALQTDGYNVYLYLDNGMENIEHVCCLAHARAKFHYAATSGGDLDAQVVLDIIAELYRRENAYANASLSPDEITKARKSPESLEIIGRLRSKMDVLLSPDHPPRGELMEKAVRYLDTFWTQIFRYTENGRYSIDNNIAERNIRPLAGERKNSLFFGSDKMAGASAIYHTVIATCRMKGISVLNYFKQFFLRIVQGQTDYATLMPETISLQS